jgi:glycosyltransferase involved in cell wall biosynthesis
MKVTQISIGRFHHFHLARQMERYHLLEYLYTGYPSFKLKDEKGIEKNKIKTFPWIHAPYMKRGVLNLDKLVWLTKAWEWIDKETLDNYVTSHINHKTILIGLSGSGLKAGTKAKKLGGIYICDRGSSHISFQDEILKEEYKTWGFKFKGIDPRVVAKEESEYALADIITVPSEYAKQSFIKMGVSESKIVKIPYGARLDRFKKISNPKENEFRVLWVGGVSINKGFMYALEAFEKLKHTSKEFIIVGGVSKEIKVLLINKDLTNVVFMGNVDNKKLPELYSISHVFLFASIDDGFGMVQAEALACGCPVIATENSGAADLFSDGIEGFIVPIRSPEAILEKLQLLADDNVLRKQMSDAALIKVQQLGGWETYGENWNKLIITLKTNHSNN